MFRHVSGLDLGPARIVLERDECNLWDALGSEPTPALLGALVIGDMRYGACKRVAPGNLEVK